MIAPVGLTLVRIDLRFITAMNRNVTMSRRPTIQSETQARVDPFLILHLDDVSPRLPNCPFERRIVMANVQKSTDSSSLAEVVDRILDKGIVIDVWAKVSLVGIELLSIEARVVIASVETYLKYAEAIGLTATAAAPA